MCEERAALLIGINEYWMDGFRADPLRYAESDCYKLKNALCSGNYGFIRDNVHIRTGSCRSPKEQPFKHNFRTNGLFAPFQNTKLDLFLFFFAGHGVEYGGKSYLVPVDAVSTDTDDIGDTCVPLASVLEMIMQIPASRRLLLFDICHAGGVQGDGQGLPLSFSEEAKKARGVIILSSCRVNELSHEDDQLKGGVFTHYWTMALRGAVRPLQNSRLTVFDVQTYAEGQVIEWAKKHGTEQCPEIWAHSPTIFLTPRTNIQGDDSIPNSLNDPLSRTETIVRQLKKTLHRQDITGPDDYCVRILARFSSFSISKRERWEGNPSLAERLRQERELLIALFEKGACLKVILSWNLEDYLSLPDMTKAKARARISRLLEFVEMIRADEKLLARATMIRIPVSEHNLMFLGDDYLFEGRNLKIGGAFDATQVITDPVVIQQQISLFDSLLASGLDYVRKKYRLGRSKNLRRKLFDVLAADLRSELRQLESNR